MTVSTTTSRADYTGNGATVAFAVPFYFLDNTHLTVLRTQVSTGAITTLALTTDYTVTGAGNPAGGTVTCVVAPASGQTLSILRNVPLTQLNTYVPNDPFPAASHERALDQLTMEVQQLDEELGRSLTIPPNVATGSISTQLPAPASGKIIGWNGSGNALANYDTSFLATVVGFGSQVSDLFSGTGSQTSFTLSQNPGSVYNLRVSISGVLQRPTVDYNWFSGTTLIFTSAPASGTNNIMVQYGSTVPQGALEWYDSDNSHVLRLSNTANYTADRTLSVNTGDADRSLTLTGNATLTGTNTGDQTITLTGDVTGTGTGSFATTISANTITSAMIVDGTIINDDIASNAAIAHSKLANITAGQVLLGNGSNIPTATALSGDVTVDSTGVTQIGSGKVVEAMLANDAVSNAKLDNMPANRFKGRITGGSGNPEDLTGTEATSLLDTFTSSLKGLAPSSGGGTTNFLRADGTWAAPSGVSDGDKGDITVSSSGSTFTIDNDVVTYAKIQNVSATDRILGRSTAGAGDIEEITCTAAGRALIDDADASAQRTTLGLAIGTNVQAYDADLAALAGISTNGVLARTGAGTAAARTITGTAPISVTDGDGVSGNPTISVSDITNTQIKSDAAIDATKLSFTQAGSGTVARTVDSKLEDFVSVKDWGAVGDNSTNDTSAIQAAEAVAGAKFVPAGTYKTTLASNAFYGPYWGRGQIDDSNDNKRAPWFSAITAAPASFGTPTSVETRFNGDLSKVQIAMEHRISGAATLGQPTTGYTYTDEAYPFIGSLYVHTDTGFNNSTSGNGGRTGAAFFRTQVYHRGQGDAVAYNASVFVDGTKSGSTSYLANPAGVIINGNMTAGADGVYLNAGEFLLDGGSYDCSGIGWVVNLDRDNDTGAKDAIWAGFRAQSKGSVAADVAFSAVNSWKFGLDLSACTFTNDAAISLKANQRIYGNVTAASTGGLRYPTAVNTDYFTFSSNISAWNFIVNNSSTLQIYGTQVVVAGGKPLVLTGSTSGSTALQATAAASGTLTFPAATDTLVGRATTDTLTNKTLTAPAFSGSSSGTTVLQASATASGTLTLPAATDTLVGKDTTDTLTNKTLSSPTFSGTINGGFVAASSSAFLPQLTARNTTNDANAAYFLLEKIRGTSDVSTASNGDYLGNFLFRGWVTDTNDLNGTYSAAANLTARVDSVDKTTRVVKARIGLQAGAETCTFYSDGFANTTLRGYFRGAKGFDINSATGEYRVDGTKVVTSRQTGWAAATGTALRTTFDADSGSLTVNDVAKRVKALIDDLITHGLIGT